MPAGWAWTGAWPGTKVTCSPRSPTCAEPSTSSSATPPTCILPGLAPEVRDHEPRPALLAPDPPYGIYERLARQSRDLLRPGGHLLVEVGAGMAEQVAQRLDAAGLPPTETRRDLAGIPRVVASRRP